MLSCARWRLYRIVRPSLVLSQSFADQLWCGQNREVVDNGRSQDQFGPGGPEVSTSAAWRSPAVRDQAKGRRVVGDPNLKLETPHGTDSSQTPRWRTWDLNFWSLSRGCRLVFRRRSGRRPSALRLGLIVSANTAAISRVTLAAIASANLGKSMTFSDYSARLF